ncbi:hypothetical protein SLA2020_381220 [Shorea laevis]
METNKPQQKKKKWFLALGFTLLLSTLLVFLTVFTSSNASSQLYHQTHVKNELPNFVESKMGVSAANSKDSVPRLAYLISGSMGDGQSLKRTLMALYHPRNQYVVHLDLEASPEERLEFAAFRADDGEQYASRGGHFIEGWWRMGLVINLSASDYPLVTQDDLLHTLSAIPRNLNFIEHTSDIGWKEYQRAKPVIIDPGFYSLHKSDVFWVSEQRSVPTAYRLFTGSAWMMLSRPFVEFCLWGWDNLPRIVLMYYANFLSSPEGYFHTVICNAPEFRNTTVNHDLHFISWDNPPKQHPHFLTVLMDLCSGGWLNSQENANLTVPDQEIANTTELRPGPGAERLKRLITGLLSAEDFHENQCA